MGTPARSSWRPTRTQAPGRQELLADGTGLACTAVTGIIPECAQTAQAWQRVENREGTRMSRLSSVRTLVNAD
jgi:hypothetical protein